MATETTCKARRWIPLRKVFRHLRQIFRYPAAVAPRAYLILSTGRAPFHIPLARSPIGDFPRQKSSADCRLVRDSVIHSQAQATAALGCLKSMSKRQQLFPQIKPSSHRVIKSSSFSVGFVQPNALVDLPTQPVASTARASFTCPLRGWALAPWIPRYSVTCHRLKGPSHASKCRKTASGELVVNSWLLMLSGSLRHALLVWFRLAKPLIRLRTRQNSSLSKTSDP